MKLTEQQINGMTAIRQAFARGDLEAASELSAQVPSRVLPDVFCPHQPLWVNGRTMWVTPDTEVWPDITISLDFFGSLRPATPLSMATWGHFYWIFKKLMEFPGGAQEFATFLEENHNRMSLSWAKTLRSAVDRRPTVDSDAVHILRVRGVELLDEFDFLKYVSCSKDQVGFVRAVNEGMGQAGVARMVRCIIPLIIAPRTHAPRRARLVQLLEKCQATCPELEIEIDVK